jgi:hypothetical protein
VRRRLVFLCALAAVAVVVTTSAAASPGAEAKRVQVTFVGDSVAASLDYISSARARLGRGLAVRYDLAVCRRLVQPSCTYNGSTPSSALGAVRSYGRSLGEVLIVKVGYNESSRGYGEGIDRVMRAARAQGAKVVVWATLRETSSIYHWTNLAIKRAAKRWPQLTVADWNAYSSGRAWFAGDGLHLTSAGANALAALLRTHVLQGLKRARAGG